METRKLLQADYLDVIFDNRNKKYGGYELRRHYNSRLLKGALGLFLCVVVLSSFSFIGSDAPANIVHYTDPIKPTIFESKPIEKPIVKVMTPKLEPKPMKFKTKAWTEPVITSDPIRPDEQMTENRNLANVDPGLNNSDGDSLGIIPSRVAPTGTGIGVPSTDNTSKPVVYVEQMPKFVGDINAYLSNSLHYPEAARSTGIEGRVIVEFVINEDGAVSNSRLVRGIGGGCDEEALRIINGMPKWKPGKQNGIAVKVLFSLPIKFVLN